MLLKQWLLRLKLIVMSRMKTTFSVRAVLLGLGLLCLGIFTDRSLAQSNPHHTGGSTAISSIEATPLVLQGPTRDDDISVAAEAGETNRAGSRIQGLEEAGVFSAASARWQGLWRRLSVPICFSQILAPKISHYISKSVLII